MKTLRKIALSAGLATAALSPTFAQSAQNANQAQSQSQGRTLSFDNLHTGEQLTVTYRRGGSYDQSALREVSNFMRDFRRNEVQQVNPELLDALYNIQTELKKQYPSADYTFEVISGFRAEETTNALRSEGAAVARKKSQHELGNAMDFRIRGIPLSAQRDAAWCLQQGGVGYYPEAHNNFVHVDVARVRFWGDTSPKWKCMR